MQPRKGHYLGPSGHDPEATRNQPGTNPASPGWFRVGSGLLPGASGLLPGWFRVMAGGPEIVALKGPLARTLDHLSRPCGTSGRSIGRSRCCRPRTKTRSWVPEGSLAGFVGGVTKPYRFIGFCAMDVTKPYRFIGFGAMDVTKPYRFIGFGARF